MKEPIDATTHRRVLDQRDDARDRVRELEGKFVHGQNRFRSPTSEEREALAGAFCVYAGVELLEAFLIVGRAAIAVLDSYSGDLPPHYKGRVALLLHGDPSLTNVAVWIDGKPVIDPWKP